MPASMNKTQQQRSLTIPTRPLVFFASGYLAGAATLPVEILYSRAVQGAPRTSSLLSLIPKGSLVATTVLRAGTRFCVFDLTRTILNRRIPHSNFYNEHARTALIGGLGGASGGLAEVLASSLVSIRPRLPSPSALANQSANLFLCFGTYTFISTTFSKGDGLPPKSFATTWAMGVIAGGIGSGILSAAKGIRSKALGSSILKGALVIGTVISVHVTSVAEMLKQVDC